MLDGIVNPPGKHFRPHGRPNRERAPLTPVTDCFTAVGPEQPVCASASPCSRHRHRSGLEAQKDVARELSGQVVRETRSASAAVVVSFLPRQAQVRTTSNFAAGTPRAYASMAELRAAREDTVERHT